MIRYAGVNLPLATPEAVAWVERHIDPRDTMEFAHRAWPGPHSLLLSWPQFLLPRRVKLGTLCWPTGAARWAVGYFLCGEQQLEKIRQLCYGVAGDYQLTPQVLELETQHGTVNPEMYLLPPRALSGMRAGKNKTNNLYLLTLVDARYFLQWQDIGEAAADTWEELLSLIEETPLFTPNGIIRDTIEDVYLGPSRTITSTHSEPLGTLLDAIAANTGRRLVRYWDSDVSEPWDLQKADRAKELLTANQQLPRNQCIRVAGRNFRFGTVLAQDEQPTGAQRERGAMLPQQVRLLFPPSFDDPYPQVLTEGWSPIDITATSRGYAQIATTVPALTQVYRDDLAVDASTGTQRRLLAIQLAQDFYDWRYEANFDLMFAGAVEWVANGLTDLIEWTYTAEQCHTRVQRGVWNGEPDKFNHAATDSGSGSGAGSSGSGCPTDTELEFTDECTGCVRTVRAYDRFGRAITFEVCEVCPDDSGSDSGSSSGSASGSAGLGGGGI